MILSNAIRLLYTWETVSLGTRRKYSPIRFVSVTNFQTMLLRTEWVIVRDNFLARLLSNLCVVYVSLTYFGTEVVVEGIVFELIDSWRLRVCFVVRQSNAVFCFCPGDVSNVRILLTKFQVNSIRIWGL